MDSLLSFILSFSCVTLCCVVYNELLVEIAQLIVLRTNHFSVADSNTWQCMISTQGKICTICDTFC